MLRQLQKIRTVMYVSTLGGAIFIVFLPLIQILQFLSYLTIIPSVFSI